MPVKTDFQLHSGLSRLHLRSMLYAPASAEHLLDKVFTAGADAVILDLEDAVAMQAKSRARELVARTLALHHADSARPPMFVRVNAVGSGLLADDLDGVVWAGLTGIKVPKVDSAAEVQFVDECLNRLEVTRGLPRQSVCLMLGIESAAGVEAAYSLATASPRVWCLSFGAADFARDTWSDLSDAADESLYARSRLVVASRAAARARPFDSVYPRLDDDDGLRTNALASRRLGYQGKSVIHPRQLAIVHQVFSPSQAELERAREIRDAFRDAEARQVAAFTFGGALVDYAMYRRAEDILAQVERPGSSSR